MLKIEFSQLQILKQFLSLFIFSYWYFYYKEVKLNWRHTIFNWSCVNDDTTTTTTKLQHSFKYRRRVCRESKHLSASFVRSLARSHMLDLLEQAAAAGFSAIGKRRSWPIWSSIHEPDNRQTPMLTVSLPPWFSDVLVRG